jgi:hypothetical protein
MIDSRKRRVYGKAQPAAPGRWAKVCERTVGA